MARPSLDLTGKKFGRLTVIRQHSINKRGAYVWLCECECGNVKAIDGSSLRSGASQSCGCLRDEKVTKHGLSSTKSYREWAGAKNRCHNPNDKDFPYYGGRGISVCDRWIHDPKAFYDDVSILPNFDNPDSTLDRIDSNGNYEPGNVRWANRVTQQNNRRNNILFTIGTDTHTLAEWAKIYDIDYALAYRRLRKGWQIEDALSVR